MKNKKGFTLIELLAVIVILAIIALIAVPVIMDVIGKANKSAFKDTAYGIISAGELYFAEQQLELNGMSEDAEFVWPNNLGTLQVKGNVPDGTILKVNTNGETALAMSNDRYCVTKGYSDSDITIVEEYTSCDIPGGEESTTKTLSDLAVVSTTLGIDSVAACLTDGTNCEAGTAFAIQVNDTDTYKFRVLSDDGNAVNLIMSENIGEPVAWINQEHYTTAGGTRWNEMTDKTSYGPITALKVLKERTAGWTNLEEYSYELTYGPVIIEAESKQVNEPYTGEYVQNVRARMPKLAEVQAFESEDWLYEGLYTAGGIVGYWLSDGSDSCSEFAYHVYLQLLTESNSEWKGIGDAFTALSADDSNYIGIRPVITLTK